jgi:hypothetical protein
MPCERNNGMLEYWPPARNASGLERILENNKNNLLFSLKSITPLFHHSNCERSELTCI